ncbi:MAG: DUF4406 domain-containing protein [Clostridia bacterium]|nr:DUF4406 domain-containing protein [Clostridia bacterium]
MNLELKNAEGYYDFTAYEAIKNISKFETNKSKNVVYICLPFNCNINKICQKAYKYSKFAFLKGYIPISVHIMFAQFMSDFGKNETEKIISMSLEILSRCDELWYFEKIVNEKNIKELEFAKKCMIKTRYFKK